MLLLQDIQNKVHSEINLGPAGGPHSNIVVGNTTPTPLPHFRSRMDLTPESEPIKKPSGYTIGSSDISRTKERPKSVSKNGPERVLNPESNGQLSFSEMMSDFFSKTTAFQSNTENTR